MILVLVLFCAKGSSFVCSPDTALEVWKTYAVTPGACMTIGEQSSAARVHPIMGAEAIRIECIARIK